MDSALDKKSAPTFYLYDYVHDWGPMGEINELIKEGKIPFDTCFRLTSIGRKVDASTRSTFLNYTMMQEIVDYVDDASRMREETYKLLYGKLPDAVVDLNSRSNYKFYPYLEPMYYRMMDLVRVIHSRRALSGDSLPDIPYPGTTKVRVPNEEWARCKAIARPIWRLIVERTHPEWFEDLDTFFVHGYIGGWGSYYEYKERTKRRGIVSHAILSDPLVMSFYQEAVATGINGIGPMGREDLRLLLIEENPELMEGNEIPSH